MFDVTFLESNWKCIFGSGCQGVLTEATPELVQGCCSYGAHFTDEKDQRRVEKAAKRLTADQWQFKSKARQGTTRVKKNGEIVTRRVDEVEDDGHVITRISQWNRSHWGAGGADFHWWCTEDPAAFVGKDRVVDSMSEELVAMVGQPVYDQLLAYMNKRSAQPKGTRLAHPVFRKRA